MQPTLESLPATTMPAIPTHSPVPSPTTIPPAPPNSGWQLLPTGLAYRTIQLFDQQGKQVDMLYLLRASPTDFRFDIAYAPDAPRPLGAWLQTTSALAVVNGGFFTPEYVATGRIVIDGIGSGVSYTGENAGMFAILPDGTPQIRWLAQQPYNPDEPLHAALQTFPMLIKPPNSIGYQNSQDRPARRTIIAQDNAGNLLFIVASRTHFTLAGMSQFLLNSDLNLTVALNLDGGTSSGILLATGEGVNAFIPLPTIITIHTK